MNNRGSLIKTMEAAIPPLSQEDLAKEARSSQGDTVTILESEAQ